jgi:SPP1 gp7 family putative phage head morphogenesis protein
MGILDFITKAQEKLNDVQKKIDTNSLESIFEKKKQTLNPNKEKKQTTKTINAEQQILALRDSFVRNGFVEYEYLANSNCCDICAKLNRKHYHLSKLEIGVNAPPMHDGCRCSIAAWSDDKEYEDWLDYLSKGGTTKEWEKRKKQ